MARFDLGWIVYLVHDQGELVDHFDTAELAMSAAEAALGTFKADHRSAS